MLIEALRDQDPLVRRFAAEALGRMGPAAREAIPALQEVSMCSDKYLAAYASRSLAMIRQERLWS